MVTSILCLAFLSSCSLIAADQTGWSSGKESDSNRNISNWQQYFWSDLFDFHALESCSEDPVVRVWYFEGYHRITRFLEFDLSNPDSVQVKLLSYNGTPKNGRFLEKRKFRLEKAESLAISKLLVESEYWSKRFVRPSDREASTGGKSWFVEGKRSGQISAWYYQQGGENSFVKDLLEGLYEIAGVVKTEN